MKIQYKLEQVYPGIFHCTIKDSYDLAMTFCRVQEYYESPLKEVRGKHFNFLEFMRLYAKKQGNGVFDYPTSWCGFNVPGSTVSNLYSKRLPDFNQYDNVILTIHKRLLKKCKNDNYYLIGSQGKKDVLYHEYCHGLYALDSTYRTTVQQIINKLNVTVRKKIENSLLKKGYCKKVLLDEIQAYLSTDFLFLRDSLKFNKKELCNFTDVHLELKKHFKPYKKFLTK
jgi:hypothetical protein